MEVKHFYRLGDSLVDPNEIASMYIDTGKLVVVLNNGHAFSPLGLGYLDSGEVIDSIDIEIEDLREFVAEKKGA